MEQPRLYNPELHGDSSKVENYRFNHIVFCDALQHSRDTDPRFKDMPLDDMAEVMGLSRSNFQRLRKGSVPDPRSSTIWLICTTLHIAPYRLMGLPAPKSEEPSQQISHELHMRDLERRDEENTRELSRLRKMVLEEGKAASAAQQHARNLEKTIATMSAEITLLRRRRALLLLIIAALLLLTAYFISEVTHPHSGLTSFFM